MSRRQKLCTFLLIRNALSASSEWCEDCLAWQMVNWMTLLALLNTCTIPDGGQDVFAACRWENDVKNTFLHLHGPSWSCLCSMSIHPKHSTHRSSNKTWCKIWNRAYIHTMGWVSSVGIATRYRLGGPGIESQQGWDFLHLSRLALGPTQPPTQRVPGLCRE